MQSIKHQIHNTEYAQLAKFHSLIDLIPSIQPLYIDIETTGFQSGSNMIYMIGLLYHSPTADCLILEQYICQKEADEYELLYHLNQLLPHFSHLVHYNGTHFDLPFLINRMKLYQLPEQISRLASIDFYQLLRPFKKFLGLDNLKLKTVEAFLGFRRFDVFSGGQLIPLYHQYLAGDKTLLKALILHNQEDMVGLYYLNQLLPLLAPALISNDAYPKPTSLGIVPPDPKMPLIGDSYWLIRFEIPQTDCPHQIYRSIGEFGVLIAENRIDCYLPVITDQLSYFFKDYQNYYYLPKEDYAIHKSVAQFVSAKHRIKATKKTAYTKKSGTFFQVPLSQNLIDSDFNQLNFFRLDNPNQFFLAVDTDYSSGLWHRCLSQLLRHPHLFYKRT